MEYCSAMTSITSPGMRHPVVDFAPDLCEHLMPPWVLRRMVYYWLWGFRQRLQCRLERNIVCQWSSEDGLSIDRSLPPGNKPVPSRPKCFPRYQPSPNPSSSSTNSIRSPRLNVNSSALRASKSSASRSISQSSVLFPVAIQNTYGLPRVDPPVVRLGVDSAGIEKPWSTGLCRARPFFPPNDL